MEDLDKKLDEILGKFGIQVLGDNSNPDTKQEIKQAFIDAGWSDNPFYYDSQSESLKKKLTGQEWYDRFEKELQLPITSTDFAFGDDRDSRYWLYRDDVIKIAKKAAGIEQ